MKKRNITKKDINKIVALGKGKGFLTYDEVNSLLQKMFFPPEISTICLTS